MSRLYAPLLAVSALLCLSYSVPAWAWTHKHHTTHHKSHPTKLKDRTEAHLHAHGHKHICLTGHLVHGPKTADSSHKEATTTKRYAYATDLFMWSVPEEVQRSLPTEEVEAAKDKFSHGNAKQYSPSELVDAGIFIDNPLQGGIFSRREVVKNIILHSTETVHPADALHVIKSWNRGLRHPGAQYIVDRDGTIYQTVDPKYATVHVDIFRTLEGVNNDNSVGIEMVRTGSQQYTDAQLDSVTKLVVYLQQRFDVADNHVYGHGQIQPSDRRDPVNFDWIAFDAGKSGLREQTVAYKRHTHSAVVSREVPAPAPQITVHMPFVEAECGQVR